MPKKLPHAHKVYGAEGINLYAETNVKATFDRIKKQLAEEKKKQEAAAKAQEERIKVIMEEQAAKVRALK